MIAIWGEEAEPVPPLTEAGSAEIGASDLCQSDIDRYIGMDVPAVTAAALVARPGSLPLHEDLVFLPVAGEPEADEAAPENAVTENAVIESAADDAPARDVPERDRAGFDADAPEPDGVQAEPEEPESVLSLAEIDALPPEQRLALFA